MSSLFSLSRQSKNRLSFFGFETILRFVWFIGYEYVFSFFYFLLPSAHNISHWSHNFVLREVSRPPYIPARSLYLPLCRKNFLVITLSFRCISFVHTRIKILFIKYGLHIKDCLICLKKRLRGLWCHASFPVTIVSLRKGSAGREHYLL